MHKKYTSLIKIPLLLLAFLIALPMVVIGNTEHPDSRETAEMPPPPKPSCAGDSLKIQWMLYNNLPGSDLIYLIHEPNFPQSPTQVQYITDLSTPINYSDNFGSLVRGYIKAPESGDYVFNLTGDDECRFWLSTDDTRENLQQIAYVDGYTNHQQYDKYASQTSESIVLVADTYYYFEGIVKEGGGGDFIEVNWKRPSNSTEWTLIEGVHLYEDLCQPVCLPKGTPCDDGDINTENDREDGFCNCAGMPTTPPNGCIGQASTIRSLFYDDILGNQLSNLTDDPSYPLSPSRAEDLEHFRTSSTNFLDNYGSRVRGYLRAPVTGDYYFNVTASDRAKVLLSENEIPDEATDEICSVNWSGLYEFDDEVNQTSAAITLQAGQFYSIEMIHKESTGSDYFAVFWKTPYQLDTNWHVISGGNLFHYDCELATFPAGTPCDDGNDLTFDDQYDGNNNCAGTPCSDPACTNALDYTPYDECATTDNHSNSPDDAWTSCQEQQSPNANRGMGHWIQYDFGQTYTLNSSQVWNYNGAGATGQGFQNVVIDYSLDGINWTELGTYNWAQATGSTDYNGFLFGDLNGVVARYLLITAIDNFDGGDCFGLSEISFSAVECAPVGTPCNDGDPATADDVYDNDCNCVGGAGLVNTCSAVTREVNGVVSSADYDAEIEVTSTGTIEAPSIVNFVAGQSVKLLPGFKANNGTHFRAKIIACSPTPLSSATVADNDPTNNTTAADSTKETPTDGQREALPTDKPAMQIYPNPTRTWTEFYFNIPEATNVKLGVFTASGQLLTWVVNGTYTEQGQHIKEFPAQHLAGGVYYVTLFTKDEVVTERLVIVD